MLLNNPALMKFTIGGALRKYIDDQAEAHRSSKLARKSRTLAERMGEFAAKLVVPATVSAPQPLAMELRFYVLPTNDPNWRIVQRVKVGAERQKKPRRIHANRIDAWIASIERNGYGMRNDLGPLEVVWAKGA